MSKRIVAIMGSPHAEGNGARALHAMVEGAKAAEATVSTYALAKLRIENCRGCRACVKNGGVCVIDDDMKPIFEAIKTADTVIIVSPIYICQVNGYVKTFLDRLYPLTDERHKPRFGSRDLIMLYTYGAPIPFVFHRYIRSTGKSLKDMGLLIKRNVVVHGCTTIDKVAKDKALQRKLYRIGEAL